MNKILYIVWVLCAVQLTSGDTLDDIKNSTINLTVELKDSIQSTTNSLMANYQNQADNAKELLSQMSTFVMNSSTSFIKLLIPDANDDVIQNCINSETFVLEAVLIQADTDVQNLVNSERTDIFAAGQNYESMVNEVNALQTSTLNDFTNCSQNGGDAVEDCYLGVENDVATQVREIRQNYTAQQTEVDELFVSNGKNITSIINSVMDNWQPALDNVTLCVQNSEAS